jgi:hypothetical protein
MHKNVRTDHRVRWKKMRDKLLVMAVVAVASLVSGLLPVTDSSAAGSGGPITGIASKCLTNQNGTVANGNPVVIDNCNSSTQQVWSWTGDKTLRVQGACLDAAGSTVGSAVRLWSCTSGTNQQWRPMADGTLINVPSNLCLETTGGASANGTTVQLSNCSGSASSQDWNISQAVITLDPPALAAHASLPSGTPNTPTPTVTVDYSMAPEFKDWVDTVAQPLMEDWYPVLADYYTYPDHNAQIWSNLKITVDPTYTANPGRADWTEGEIVLSADYVRTHMDDGGLVIHEMTHLLQFNPITGTAPLPSWVEEGWADHAREVIYQDRPLRQPVGDERYTSGYSPTSLLLNQAEQANANNFIKEVAKRGWNNTYTDAMFAEVSGASIFKNWFDATGQATTEMNDFVHAVSGKCIDLPSWNTADGTQMHIQTCNGSTAEDWYFKETAAGAKTGLILGYGDKCIGVIGNTTANGSQVAYYGCGSSSNAGQKWEYVGGTLRNPNSGKCLQPVGGSTVNLTKLEIQPCDGSTMQQWTLPTMYKSAPSAVTSRALYATTFADGQQGIGTTDGKGNGYNRILTAPANNTYTKPRGSSGGARVTFFQTTTGQQTSTLRIANTDGTSNNQRNITDYFIPSSAPQPFWSSANDKVLVAVTPNGQTPVDKQWRWMWVNYDGSGQQLVGSSAIGGTPFAATSTKIFFVNDGAGEQQFCSVNIDGTGEACFGSAAVPKSMALAPNGARIASLATGTTTSIQVTSVGGSTSSVSLSGLGGGLTNVEEVTWVPTTTKIAFKATVSGRSAWYAIDAVSPGQISKLNIDASGITWYASSTPILSSAYNALTPFRVTDTRTASGQLNAGKTLAPGATLDIQVAGLGGVPAEGASAVVLNITEAATTSNGFVTVWPTGTTLPTSSTLNNTPNKILNNQTTVGLGTDGKVSLFNQLGTTDLVVDVVGYYGEVGGSFTPTAPKRVIDTRDNGGAPVAAWATKNVQVTGVQGIPSNATGVVADVTEVGATGTGFLTLYPAGASLPTASSVNFYPNETLTKEVNVRLSAGGAVAVTNSSPGTTHFIIDVVGYYTNDMSGMAYTPINPSRIADTRAGSGQPYAGQPLTAGMTKLFTIGSALMPTNATSVVNNMTVASGTAGNYLLAFPASSSTPPAGTSITHVSPVSFNQSTVQLSGGPTAGFKVYNHVGTTELVLDSLGYYY